jgi:hypothetical protein
MAARRVTRFGHLICDLHRQCRETPECPPRASSRPGKVENSRGFSADASTRGRTWRTCWPNALRPCPHSDVSRPLAKSVWGTGDHRGSLSGARRAAVCRGDGSFLPISPREVQTQVGNLNDSIERGACLCWSGNENVAFTFVCQEIDRLSDDPLTDRRYFAVGGKRISGAEASQKWFQR